jgi:uncharacterized protein
MKIGIGLLAAGAVAMIGGSIFGLAQQEGAPKDPVGAKKKVLFFSPSFGFRHEVVHRPLSGDLAFGEKLFKEFAGKAGYDVDVSQDFNDLLEPGHYKKYAAIVFYTTGNPPINRDGLLNYVRDGGALIGIHTATDTFHDPNGRGGPPWPEYVHMIGGSFTRHGPAHDPVVVKVEDADHPATKMLQDGWKIGDELYIFKDFSRDNVHVLLSVNTEKTSEKSLKGHEMQRGQDYAISWTRTEGKGRVFYTSLGHDDKVWENPLWQQHLLAGMAWAIEKKGRVSSHEQSTGRSIGWGPVGVPNVFG